MPGYANPITDFSLAFIKHVLKNRGEINYTISTTSLYLALVMIEAGSKNKSRLELAKLLGVDFSSLLSNHDNQLFVYMKELYEHLNKPGELITRIFTSVDLERNYVELINGLFDVTGEYLSFDPPSAAVETINRWVEERTHGRVTKFLKESNITPYTVMGLWNESFSERLTKKGEFSLENGKTVTVPFMKRKGKVEVYEDKNNRFRAIIMDFQSGNYAGVFLLPKEHITLKEFISTIKASDLIKLVDRSQKRELTIKIPKFKVDRKTKAKKILKSLGINSIFDINKSDLSNMSDLPIFVDDIFQRSTVEIDEKGVSAAAVTDTDDSAIVHTYEQQFYLNRPFIFIVMGKGLGIPLFVNAIYDPSKS